MWYQTKASQILGIQYPILQGPFGGNLSSVGWYQQYLMQAGLAATGLIP
jgi:nitronate monooxygenase